MADERIEESLEEIKDMLAIVIDKLGDPSETAPLGKRAKEMIQRYGEHVGKTTAAQILGVTKETVRNMLADGRITGACCGSKVSTRSIAEYLDCPYSLKTRETGRNPR